MSPDTGLYGQADLRLGARLYDNWPANISNALLFSQGGFTPMFSKNPIYSDVRSTAPKQDTWRCKLCHGWDYAGKTLQVENSPPVTVTGLQNASSKTPTEVFWQIAKGREGHAFGNYLNQDELWALTRFVREGIFDTSKVIDSDGNFSGNLQNGEKLYLQACSNCHGSNGNAIDFRSRIGLQGLSWRANSNPAITLHRVSWGKKVKTKSRPHSGSIQTPRKTMPAALLDLKLNREQIVDILTYVQTLDYMPSPNRTANGDLQDRVPDGTLTATEVAKLFSGKTVTSTTAVRKRKSTSYYNPNGEILQLRKGITRRGKWRVNKKGRMCLQMADLPEKCRIIVKENGTYKKYIVRKSGQHQHSVTYETFREGNQLEI